MENPSIWTSLYYISCMIIAAAAVIGIWQLFIIKHDIKTRYRRAALECSMKIIDRYYDKTVKITDVLFNVEQEKNVPEYKGTIESLPAIDNKIMIKRLEILSSAGIHRFFNDVEFISTGALSGLCDENLVFETIGRSLSFQETRYNEIIKSLNKVCVKYKYTLKLFEIWRDRLKKKKLEIEKEKITKKQQELIDEMGKLVDKRISSIK